MYSKALPHALARTKLYHGVTGAYFPETMTPFGTYANGDYGWDRAGHQPNEVLCPWWQYAWNQGLELVMLMLDRYDHQPSSEFLHKTLAPMARAVLDYFDSRFPREGGKLELTPTQAVETYWYDVINDTPSLAGLHAIVPRLSALPGSIPGWPAAKLRAFELSLPPIPTKKGKIAPAQAYKDQRNNVENPEFYAIWPFRLYGVGKLGLAMAQKTFRERIERSNLGWQYDGQTAALCGLTDDAQQSLLAKAANSNPAYRWPATWGPNYDWLPDQDHGSNLMLTLQSMALQESGGKLYILPAWPTAWDISFRLHASHGTVVEVEYKHGRLIKAAVTPLSRRADLILKVP
jgi:hypothetical protein